MKETENLIFVGVRLIFFTHEHQKGYFHLWLRHSGKYSFWCSFDEIKIDLTPKKSNILYLLTLISGFGRLVHGQKMAKDRYLMAKDSRDRTKDYC